MTIKELETILEISRANIRFYEKEGIISPERQENGYRNYSDEDVSTLEKTLILRKLGVSVVEIKSLFENKSDLQEIINLQIKELSTDIDQLKSCLELCKKIQSENVSLDQLNHLYLQDIKQKEAAGETYIDITSDILTLGNLVWESMWSSLFLIHMKQYREKHGIKLYFFIILTILILRGIGGMVFWNQNFLNGFFYPLSIFAIVSAIYIPIYLLYKKRPKIGMILFRIVLYCSLLFIAAVAILLILLLLNHFIHFWY